MLIIIYFVFIDIGNHAYNIFDSRNSQRYNPWNIRYFFNNKHYQYMYSGKIEG